MKKVAENPLISKNMPKSRRQYQQQQELGFQVPELEQTTNTHICQSFKYKNKTIIIM